MEQGRGPRLEPAFWLRLGRSQVFAKITDYEHKQAGSPNRVVVHKSCAILKSEEREGFE